MNRNLCNYTTWLWQLISTENTSTWLASQDAQSDILKYPNETKVSVAVAQVLIRLESE